MTRADEAAIYSPEAKTLREKKVSDLKNRVALINGTPGALLVSIHQNSLPWHPSTHAARRCSSTPSTAAGEVAQGVQQALNVSLDGGKTVKAMDGGVYLMKHVIRCPGGAGRVRVPLKRRGSRAPADRGAPAAAGRGDSGRAAAVTSTKEGQDEG